MLDKLKFNYANNWKMLFEFAKLGYNINKPLTSKILENPKHKITKLILYLSSMESFIYPDMNRASRK